MERPAQRLKHVEREEPMARAWIGKRSSFSEPKSSAMTFISSGLWRRILQMYGDDRGERGR
jgi:hypothetical protein